MSYIVYDCKLRRPGCALLQAALGGDQGIASLFPTTSWLLAPTPDLRRYQVMQGELLELIRIAEDEHGRA